MAFGKILLPFIKLALILAFVISFFAVVKLFKYLNTLYFIFITVVVVASFAMLTPIALIMSSLYETSTKFTQYISPKIHLVTGKKSTQALLMDLKSCPLIRCSVGNMYHMESKAKLTMIHNVLNGVAYLLVNVKV